MFALPAVPALTSGAATASVSAAATVPAKARFWAIYISALHGECTPQTLQNMLHIPASEAKSYIGQLIADGVIKPNPFAQNAVSELMKPRENSPFEKVKQRFEKKAEARAEVLDVAKGENEEKGQESGEEFASDDITDDDETCEEYEMDSVPELADDCDEAEDEKASVEVNQDVGVKPVG